MKKLTVLAGMGVAAIALAACQSVPKDMTVADYCANPKKTFENVCRLKVEIDGNQTALRNTDLRLAEALSLVDKAQSTANSAVQMASAAQSSADRAQSTADAAMVQALRDEDMVCETLTLQKTKIGQCRPGYRVMSCTQSRYTYRAGGPSILREINDEECRFHDRVLEMKVRCCAMASSAPQPVNMTIDRNQPETYPQTKRSSPYRY